jgi:RNA polymerase sigma-70 factor (ECF subfamily)
VAETERTLTPDEEAALIARARDGDERAFGEIVRAHHDRVFRQVFSMIRNEHDARDVAQEVWVTAWQRVGDFRGDARFTTWLHPIATRRALDHLRKRKRWFSRFLPFVNDGETAEGDGGGDRYAAAPEPVVDENPRDDIERTERNERFERALATLPPKHRAVLALREIQGLSYDEIASSLKCRPGTVMSRLFHARRLLVKKLRDLPCE